jgi:hypothetical protein
MRVAFSEGLELEVDLAADTLTFTSQLTAVNDGEGVALVTGVVGRLTNGGTGQEPGIPFSLSDLSCTSGREAFQFPASIGPSESLPMRCELTTRWSGRARELLGESGVHELDVRLTTGGKGEHGQRFCFALPVDVEGWFAGGGAPLRFENASCALLLG